MTDYPPFSGPEPVCPKCSLVGATTEYRNERQDYDLLTSELPFLGGDPSRSMEELEKRAQQLTDLEQIEYLRRQCLRCSWSWREAVTGGEPV